MQLWNGEPRHSLPLIVLGALLIRLLIIPFSFGELMKPEKDLLTHPDISRSGPEWAHRPFGWEIGSIAQSIALGRGFASPYVVSTGPTALLPPLYPYLLAATFRLFGVYSARSDIAILS